MTGELFEVCLQQAKELCREFDDFYSFAFGLALDGQVVPVTTYFGEDHPVTQDVIENLEKALAVANEEQRFREVAICVDVIASRPGHLEKKRALELRVGYVGGVSENLYIPFIGRADFALAEQFKLAGTLNIALN